MGLCVSCPAACAVNPPGDGPSVVCGALERSNDDAQHRGYRKAGQVRSLISGRTDANLVLDFCAGKGVPGGRQSYTACVIWQAEKHRIWAGRRMGQGGLRDEQATRPPTIDPELAAALRPLPAGG